MAEGIMYFQQESIARFWLALGLWPAEYVEHARQGVARRYTETEHLFDDALLVQHDWPACPTRSSL
eukprot:6180663-Pleurochrysis_carterae.AAC.6